MQVSSFSSVTPVKNSSVNANSLSDRPVQTFRGSYVDSLYEKVQGKEVFKNATNLQFNSLRTYIMSKRYALGIKPEDVAELSKYDGDEFLVKSHEYILKKLQIPEEIAPPFIAGDLNNKQALMMYMPSMNIIMVNSKECEKFDKTVVFKMLRHEIQHYIQNVNILRHETFGDKAIDVYKNKYMEFQRLVFENLYSNNLIEQFIQTSDIPDNEKALLYYFKSLKDSHNNEGINALFDNMSKDYVKNLVDFKDKVRKNLGLIPANSPKTEKIEMFFNEFKALGYFNPNGEVDYSKYFKSVIEQNAILAQERAGYEFSQQGCFIKYSLDTFENVIKHDDIKAEMNKIDVQG